MLFFKKYQPASEPLPETKNVWRQLDYTFSDCLVFLDDIRWSEDGFCMILSMSDENETIVVRFESIPCSYRVTQESYDFNPFDGYVNADELSFKDHKIFYTQDSEYLDWFYATSEMHQKRNDSLYHIQIITEDMIVDVIDDQLPTVTSAE